MATAGSKCNDELTATTSARNGESTNADAPTSQEIPGNSCCTTETEQLFPLQRQHPILRERQPTEQNVNGNHKEEKQAKSKKKKTRRGCCRRNKSENLVVTGTNANGLNTKKDSLLDMLETEKPHVFMIQETKMKRKNQWIVDEYELFEKPRKGKEGGGILIGIRRNLDCSTPVIVSDNDDDEVEILVVEVSFKSLTVRFLTAYGPQEEAPEDKVNKFYSTLEEEIIQCEKENCALIAELDCNAKLGNEIIKGDPNTISANGRILQDILERRECVVVNASDKCTGTITRSRMKGGSKEESVLDYVIVNAAAAPYVQTMVIDESKAKALTRFTKGKAVPSDHNLLICTFNIPLKKALPPRKEIYRLRNPEELQTFKETTSNTKAFTQCFMGDDSVKKQGKAWINLIQKTIRSSFKKIRINNNKPPKDSMREGMEKRKQLLKKMNTCNPAERHKLEDEVLDIENQISEGHRSKQVKKLEEHISIITDKEGRVNTAGAWKLRRKIFPKPPEQLTSKKNKEGDLVTNPDKIKDIYLEAYTDRLKHREIIPELQNLRDIRERLFQTRLEQAKQNKSPPWTMDQLEAVLSKLKSNKATDPIGLVNEIFMLKNIGTDLKESLLILLNKIKDQFEEPEFMQLANVTSFWKGKGSKSDIENERGIFILVVLRMIKDRMIFNDTKDIVEISDSQVGGRTDFSFRNHLFIVYSVINSVIHRKETPSVDIHLYDLRKCFDGLWLEECCNNLYEAGITDDKLALIFEGNKTNQVAIKTPGGLTDRVTMERIVMQGGVTGPLCCSVQTDNIGKASLESNEHLYMYKGSVGIPTLAMVDDLLQISECGIDAVKDNAYINARIEQNKQAFNDTKCHQMHVGGNNNFCSPLRAHTDEMDLVSEDKYVGDVISIDGKHSKNIDIRRSKGIGISNEIIAILNDMLLGPHYFVVALILRQALLISVLLGNAETWLRLSKENIKKLESIDLMLLRKLLKTPISTPKVSLYLETGSVPLRYVIKRKRIMFLHHIVTRETNALINRVFWAQVHDTTKGDWCDVVREDLDMLGLSNVSFEDIGNMSKEVLKDLITERTNIVVLENLLSEKNSLSKMAQLSYDKLEIQPYLTDPKLPIRLKQQAFRWRTRMVKVGWNYGKKEQCPICSSADDTQSHLLECDGLKIKDSASTDCSNDTYDLNSHMLRLQAAIRRREVILDERDNNKNNNNTKNNDTPHE